jgi:predicted Rossmann fold nucleotide-binding protein DprA/Smf involved in DNA uptake
LMGVAALADATGLEPARIVAALLELELAGLARRSASGAEAIAVPLAPANRGPPRRS